MTKTIQKIHSRGRVKYRDSCLLLSLTPEMVSWELSIAIMRFSSKIEELKLF